MLQRMHVRTRVGFTLIEMLIVITIIGMLMALSSFAVWKVIQSAKQAKIHVEIEQMAQSMVSYKQDRIQYPPCMGTISITDRKMGFLRHISLAFANANYGTTAANFDALRNRIMTATTPTNWNYNYRNASGSIAQLDLHNLDQAEALVFWLGGFPTPYKGTSPVAGRRLFGFHSDDDNPFKRDAFEGTTPLQFRTDLRYSFEETRLVDNDGDGWLEYLPSAQRFGEANAPFVYFDADTYGLSTNTTATAWLHYGYPRPDNNGTVSPAAKDLASRYGIASPLATYMDAAKANPVRWAKPTDFQIICAGLDGLYCGGIDGGGTLSSQQRTPIFPNGVVFSGAKMDTEGYYTREDLDNQTNLSSKTLEGARGEAQ